MTESQNTKDEQQNDLCITSEQLTEKWKKGELPKETECYVRVNGDIYLGSIQYKNGCHNKKLPYVKSFNGQFITKYVEEVLAEVPSYEQWQAKIEENTALKEQLYKFVESNQSLRKQLDEEKAKNRIDYNGSPMDFLDECERDRKKNKIYKNWINNIREELIISDLRRTVKGNKFIVNLLTKINQVLGEE